MTAPDPVCALIDTSLERDYRLLVWACGFTVSQELWDRMLEPERGLVDAIHRRHHRFGHAAREPRWGPRITRHPDGQTLTVTCGCGDPAAVPLAVPRPV